MESYIKAYEYESNVNPLLAGVPIVTKNISDSSFGLQWLDLSKIYAVEHSATSPNLLAGFIKLRKEEHIVFSQSSDNSFNASSNFFYILSGVCSAEVDGEQCSMNSEDIFIFPRFEETKIFNSGETDVCIYYINDSPLINYLGSIAQKKLFKASLYSKAFLQEKLQELSNPNNNRKGILLSNTDTEKIGINTITPILWSLYNELPPKTLQLPHRHNSVALDLCIICEDSENVYTLIGDKLDEKGNIINPTKKHWKTGEMFITPPGLWHSHNNVGNTYAYVLPIQDAGLLLFQRILGIEIYKN